MTRIGCKMANSYLCDIYMCSDYTTLASIIKSVFLKSNLNSNNFNTTCLAHISNSHFTYFYKIKNKFSDSAGKTLASTSESDIVEAE